METFKVLLNFTGFGEAQFGAKAELIVTSLTTEPMLTLVPNPIPVTFPARTALTAELAVYKAAVVGAADGSKTAIKERVKQRGEMEQLLKDFAPHLEVTAKAANNIAILTQSGYDLRRPIVKPTTNGVPPAPVISLRRGKVSGAVIARVKPLLPHVGSYEGQFAVGTAAAEENFQAGVISNAGSRITFTELEIAKIHQIRVRGIGSKGPGDWSDPVSIIVT